MNTALTVWSIFAGDRVKGGSYTDQLCDWCYSENRIAFQVLSCDDALSRKTHEGECPDLILINSSRRGEFSEKLLQQVVSKYPLSLLVNITGAWCIGDTRSGDPLPIACRFDVAIACQRLQSMLSSREHFLQVRADLNPLSRFAGLFSFENRNNRPPNGNSLNVIASCRSERQSLKMLLQQEGYNVYLHSCWETVAVADRYLTNIVCITDRRELGEILEKSISASSVIITSYYNGRDKEFFEAKSSVHFLRKPFLSHDLVNEINGICFRRHADAA